MEINEGTAVIPEDAPADSETDDVTTLELTAAVAEETLSPTEEFVKCMWPCKATMSHSNDSPKA